MQPTHLFPGHRPSPLSAFRSDLPADGRRTTLEDARFVVIASLLQHAACSVRTSVARRSIAAARRLARDMFTAQELADGPYLDEPGRDSDMRLFRMVVDRAIRTGNVSIASHMVDSIMRMVEPDTLEAGRLRSNQAAVSWYAGSHELSFEQMRQLEKFGRSIREPELVARGMQGMAHAAWSAGNLPAAVRLARRVIRGAGAKSPRVACLSQMTLGISAAVTGDFDAALAHSWRAYKQASQHGLRENALVNITQILLDAGYPAAAQAAARHLLRQRSFIAAPAILGAYALASAALNDGAAVEWAVAQALEQAKSPSFQREKADSLLECSFALEQTGRVARARQVRGTAHELAARHGYHDIAYLAEHGVRRGAPRVPLKINKATEAIVTEIGALEIDRPPLLEMHVG